MIFDKKKNFPKFSDKSRAHFQENSDVGLFNKNTCLFEAKGVPDSLSKKSSSEYQVSLSIFAHGLYNEEKFFWRVTLFPFSTVPSPVNSIRNAHDAPPPFQ